jgi:hypothetical protein
MRTTNVFGPTGLDWRTKFIKSWLMPALATLGIWAGAPVQADAGPIVHLVLNSQPGDFIGGGKSFDLTYPQPGDAFFVFLNSTLPSGAPTNVSFILGKVTSGADNTYATLDFGTNQLGAPLVPGTFYDNAQREPFAQPGHPGLDVDFQNRGSNTLTGNFTINDLTYTTDPVTGAFVLLTFDATFEQHSESPTAPALFGEITYAADGVLPTPEPTSLALFGLGAVGIAGWRWSRRKQSS